MKSAFMPALKIFAVLTVVLGIAYPLAVTLIAQSLFSEKANGSLIVRDSKVIGSELIAQKIESPRYFWPRPSASDYAAVPSGASNQGPTSKALFDVVAERRAKGATGEMLFASASGLDPHISLDAAIGQVPRIVQARSLGDKEAMELRRMVNAAVERRDFGFLGEERINVMKLNLSLDEHLRK